METAQPQPSMRHFERQSHGWSRIMVLGVAISILSLAAGSLSGCGASSSEQEAVKQADYHYQLGVSHFGGGEVPQAIRELVSSLHYQEDHAEALHLLGFIYMGRKQYPEAIRHFQAALDANPDYFICKNNLGVAYLFMEQWEDAAKVFEELRTASLYTSPWLAYANLGWAYHQMGMTADGIEQTKMALFLNPEMCLAQNNLGIMYVDQYNGDDAMTSFSEAINLCPGYAEPHLHLGQLWAEVGNMTKAKNHFRKCVELSPRSDLGQRCKQNSRMYH